MFEGTASSSSIPSIWSSMYSWFTPAVLFLLLNLMICTIAFTSTFSSSSSSSTSNPPNKQQDPTTTTTTQPSPTLDRSPSSVIQRLRSFNLHSFRSPPSAPDQPKPTETHFVSPQTHIEKQLHFEEEAEEADDDDVPGGMSIDDVYSQLGDGHVSRTRSDTKPDSGVMPERLPARMRKSASMKSAFGHFEEGDVAAVEARRPATVKEGKARVTDGDEDDDEVDAKADDFINRFKQQLKLQRLDSIVRYKEMIGRGVAK